MSLTGIPVNTGYRLLPLNSSEMVHSGDDGKDCGAATH